MSQKESYAKQQLLRFRARKITYQQFAKLLERAGFMRSQIYAFVKGG